MHAISLLRLLIKPSGPTHARDFLFRVINKAEWTLWILIKFIDDGFPPCLLKFGIYDLKTSLLFNQAITLLGLRAYYYPGSAGHAVRQHHEWLS